MKNIAPLSSVGKDEQVLALIQSVNFVLWKTLIYTELGMVWHSLLRWLQESNLFWPRQVLDNVYLKEVIKRDTLKWFYSLTIWALEINHEECFSGIRENIFVNLMHLKNKIRLDSDERLELDYGIKIKTLKFICFKRLLWPSHTYHAGTWHKLHDCIYL